MAITFYNQFKKELLDRDLGSATIRVALVDNSTAYSPDIDAEHFVSDVLDGGTTAQELSGTGYSRKTAANVATSIDDTDDEGVLDFDDITWSGLDTTEDIQGVLTYIQIGGDDTSPGDDPLIGYDETDADLPLPTNGSDVTYSINAEGYVNAT